MNANIICTPQRLLKVTKAKRSLFKPLLTFLWTTLALVFFIQPTTVTCLLEEGLKLWVRTVTHNTVATLVRNSGDKCTKLCRMY